MNEHDCGPNCPSIRREGGGWILSAAFGSAGNVEVDIRYCPACGVDLEGASNAPSCAEQMKPNQIEEWLAQKQQEAEGRARATGDYTKEQRHVVHLLLYCNKNGSGTELALHESLVDVLRQFKAK